MLEFSQLLEAAEHHEKNGQWLEAEIVYRNVLQSHSQNEVALLRLAEVISNQGRLLDASEVYLEVLRQNSQCVDAMISLGITQARLRQLDEAVNQFRGAIHYDPNSAKAYNNLGVALGELGNFEQAIAAVEMAIQLQPRYAEAHYNHGTLLSNCRNRVAAGSCFREALRIRPDYVEAMTNLGLNLLESHRASEAVIILKQARRLQPKCIGASNNLALALTDCGKFDEAIATWEELLGDDPNNADYHSNLGSTLDQMGRIHEALACYEHAVRLKPDNASIRWNRALSLLHAGEFEEGWQEYEWRWKRGGSQPRKFAQPEWDGTPLKGRTIFVHTEQGLGDIIMFARYLPLLKAMGGRVLVECPPAVANLLGSCDGIDEIIKEGDALCPFHVHAPLMSMPRLFGTDLSSIPSAVPYLAADPELVEAWGKRLKHIQGKKIGICWQGNPQHRWDHHRSIPLHEFSGLACIPGISLISLQPNKACETLSFKLTEFAGFDAGRGFADSAAVMQHLDTIITCDTSIAHLAGALGKRVWLLRSKIGDWRWLTVRSSSPWYPTMRIYRQEHVGEWQHMFTRVKRDILEELLGTEISNDETLT